MKKINGTRLLSPINPKREDVSVTILIGTPTLGHIRIEWHNAMVSMVVPPNWATVRSTPLGYSVGDAQNTLVDTAVRGNYRALLLIEDDTVPPPNTLLDFDRWLWKMERGKAPPVVSGLYHIKNSAEVRRGKRGGIEVLGLEPLAYRGSGTRAYRDWTPGDVIWVSGVPTGALLIHRSVLEAWIKEPDVPDYQVPGYPFPVKRVFQQPAKVWVDPGTGQTHMSSGTTDLHWSAETIRRDILTKAGWPQFAKKEFPYVIDTALRFGHLDRLTGEIF